MISRLPRTLTAALFLAVVGAAQTASAALIEGTFTLTANTPPAIGATWSGTFEYDDTTLMAGTIPGETVAELTDFFFEGEIFNNNGSASVVLAFDLGDQLAGSDSPVAVFHSSDSSIAFLRGEFQLGDGVNPPTYSLSLTGDLTTGNNGDFSFGGLPPLLSTQGDQTVPEPTTLGLFGAGILGLGLVRRRRRRVS